MQVIRGWGCSCWRFRAVSLRWDPLGAGELCRRVPPVPRAASDSCIPTRSLALGDRCHPVPGNTATCSQQDTLLLAAAGWTWLWETLRALLPGGGGCLEDSPSSASMSKRKYPKGGTPLCPSVCLGGLCVPLARGDSAYCWLWDTSSCPCPRADAVVRHERWCVPSLPHTLLLNGTERDGKGSVTWLLSQQRGWAGGIPCAAKQELLLSLPVVPAGWEAARGLWPSLPI